MSVEFIRNKISSIETLVENKFFHYQLVALKIVVKLIKLPTLKVQVKYCLIKTDRKKSPKVPSSSHQAELKTQKDLKSVDLFWVENIKSNKKH